MGLKSWRGGENFPIRLRFLKIIHICIIFVHPGTALSGGPDETTQPASFLWAPDKSNACPDGPWKWIFAEENKITKYVIFHFEITYFVISKLRITYFVISFWLRFFKGISDGKVGCHIWHLGFHSGISVHFRREIPLLILSENLRQISSLSQNLRQISNLSQNLRQKS